MELSKEHNFYQSLLFRLKVFYHIVNRSIKNSLSSIRKYKKSENLKDQPVIAFSESELWNKDDNKDNWILTAGKVHNLRLASKKLNGLEIKANEVFSFWKHVGNPNFGNGFVVGREIREGCILPTIAGGLCQLSNALYDAALKANFEIIERHKHSQIIKGSLAELDRDATVKWNYVDLRFKSNYDFRIEIELTADQLIVSYKSEQINPQTTTENFKFTLAKQPNDCYSCGDLSCFKHPDRLSKKQKLAISAFILDEKWEEFDQYINSIAQSSDYFIVPLRKNRWIKTNRYDWTIRYPENIKTTWKSGVYRAIKLRNANKAKNNVFELQLELDKKIAQEAAKRIPIEATHLIISQNLLPFLYETGALGGRTYEVLMNRLPMEDLHQRLDEAHAKHPDSSTLNDFRAPHDILELEKKALKKAEKIISPHEEIVQKFREKSELLDWHLPKLNPMTSRGNKILFPASAVGRKGAYEIKKLAQELDLELVISGKLQEHESFWESVKTEPFNGDFNQIKMVIYPTYVEHQPRMILKAMAMGIPIVTTKACGIQPSDKVKVLETGNYKELKNEIERKISIQLV